MIGLLYWYIIHLIGIDERVQSYATKVKSNLHLVVMTGNIMAAAVTFSSL